MQHRFAVKLFTGARAMGIHTALDTNGYLGDRLTDEELNAIDLVLLDIKAFNADRHLGLTGMSNEPVLTFARRLAERNKPVWLRFVLVPGLTDDPAGRSRPHFWHALGSCTRLVGAITQASAATARPRWPA